MSAHMSAFRGKADQKYSLRAFPLLTQSGHRDFDKEIIETEAGHRRLAGYLLRQNADRVAPHARR
jgi:hypothetical protein